MLCDFCKYFLLFARIFFLVILANIGVNSLVKRFTYGNSGCFAFCFVSFGNLSTLDCRDVALTAAFRLPPIRRYAITYISFNNSLIASRVHVEYSKTFPLFSAFAFATLHIASCAMLAPDSSI